MFRGPTETIQEAITMETGNAYDTCNCGQNLFQIEQKMTNILRKVYIVFFATFVLCLVSLVACGCTIYLYTETSRTKSEAGSSGSEPLLVDDGAGDEYYYDFLTSDDEYAELDDRNGTASYSQTEQHREKRKDQEESKNGGKNKEDKPGKVNQDKRRHGRGNKAMKCYKRLERKLKKLQKTVERMKREVQSVRNTTKVPIQRTTIKPTVFVKESTQKQNFIPHVAAAHYTSFVDNDFIKSQFPPIDPGNMALTPHNPQGKPSSQTGYTFKEHCKILSRFTGKLCKNKMLYFDEACMNKPEWNGYLCRNRTLIISVAPTRLNVFKEAVWMKNISSQQVFDMRDGIFYAKHTGIYLVYAHVLFYDSRKTQAIELVHASGGKDANKFRCSLNTDNGVPQPGFARDTEYMSCSVNIVLYMEKHDTVEILNLFPNSSVDLSPDSTYFGGLVFVNVDD